MTHFSENPRLPRAATYWHKRDVGFEMLKLLLRGYNVSTAPTPLSFIYFNWGSTAKFNLFPQNFRQAFFLRFRVPTFPFTLGYRRDDPAGARPRCGPPPRHRSTPPMRGDRPCRSRNGSPSRVPPGWSEMWRRSGEWQADRRRATVE